MTAGSGAGATPVGPLGRLWAEVASPEVLASLLDPTRLACACPPASSDRLAAIAPGLAERALAELGTPWPQTRASDYVRYFRDGNRTAYERTIGARHERLSRAVAMALASEGTGGRVDDRRTWLDEVADGVILFCEQSSWCWAAHDDVRTRTGNVLPDVESPFLDLGAGEVAAQLAWVDLALGDALDGRFPGLRERMRLEAARRVFGPFLSRRDWHWLGLDGDVHNWNPWIHGNLIVAACALAGDPTLRARIVALAIDGMDRYLASIPADGAIDEGYAYWWNGAARALEALEILGIATGGRLSAASLDLVAALVRFPVRMHVDGPWYVNVGDAPARLLHPVPWRTLAHWGRIAGEDAVVGHARAQAAELAPMSEAIGLGRLLLALSDPNWPPAAAPASAAAPGGVAPVAEAGRPSLWLGSVHLMVARTDEAARSIVVAAKGGHNGEHHNHLDLGSFTLAVDGTPVLVDAGQPTYTAQTFGPDRYSIRAMQSGWHSTPAPWGLEQSIGREAAAISTFDDDGSIARADFHLTRAYPLLAGSRWSRVVELRRSTCSVIVADEWQLPRPDSPAFDGVLIRYLVNGDVVITGPSSAVVHPAPKTGPGGGRSLELRWEGAEVQLQLETWRLDDPLLQSVWGDQLVRLTAAVRVPATHPGSAFAGRLALVASPLDSRP